MDLVKEAIFLGFSGAAVMDTKELVFLCRNIGHSVKKTCVAAIM